MIGCDVARSLLLEAESAELTGQGQGTGELEEHLRGCPECRIVAARLLAAQRGLAGALDAERSRRGPDEAARRALVGGRAGGQLLRWRRVLRWVPLAAAAALAVLLLGREPRLPPATPTAVARAEPELEVDVRLSGARTAAVFRTDDPNIVVVWFF